MHIYDWEKLKPIDLVDLREKVDFYSMDVYGRIDGSLKDEEFSGQKAISHSKKLINNDLKVVCLLLQFLPRIKTFFSMTYRKANLSIS